MKKKQTMEDVVHGVFLLLGLVTVGCVLLITVYLILSGLPAITKIGLGKFLFGTEWASTAADPKYGILPFILTSVYGTCGAILLGVPVGFLTAVYLALVIYAVAKKLIHKRFELWCLAAITGGAIGNLIDRVQTGLVVDMICIPWFSTFNVADIFITFGAILLVLYILIKDKEFLEDKPKKSKEQGNDAETGK